MSAKASPNAKYDLPLLEWPYAIEITAKTSPRGQLPIVKELGPVDGLVAWAAAGGDPTALMEHTA